MFSTCCFQKKYRQFGKIVITLSVYTLFLLGAGVASAKDSRVLVYARISKNPTAHYAPLKQVVDYVAARMGEVGIEKGEILLAKDEHQLSQYVRENKVDWVTGSFFTALSLKQSSGVTWLLRRWKNGVSEYHTLFLTKRGSPIDTLEALQGGKIALEDASSTSGFMIPLLTLLEQKLDMALIPTFRATPPATKTAYVFSGSSLNTASWVASGLVDAGAVSDVDWQNNEDIPATLKSKLRIIHQSATYPRAIEMVRQDLPATVKQKLKELLEHLHEQAEGVAILNKFSATERFDDLPIKTLNQLEQTKTMMPLLLPHLQP